MKKITVLLAMLLVFSLTACNNANENTAVADNGGDTAVSDTDTVTDTVTDTTTPEAENTTAPETEGEKTTENNGETVTEGSEDVTEPETEGTTMPETTDPEVTTTPEVPVEDEKNQATTEPDTDDSSVISETSNPTPEHKHAYKDTVVAPTCENGGYTVHTCDCGHSYSDKETKATGHSYTEKVVAPTTSAKGYTLHTCSKCGTSYKDSYVDKLPTQTTTPSNPGNTGDTGYEEGGWKGDDYGSGEKIEGNEQIAGQFVDHKGYSRKFYTDGMTAADARTALNSYVGYVYGRRFFSDGISINDADTGKFAKIVTHEDGRLGVNVFGWRKSYDSDVVQNSCINMVMEAFYFMTGDREVAYALWSAVDYLNVAGGGSISNDKLEAMGFTLSNETSRSIEMVMNGVHIYWEWPAGTTSNIFYFG